MAWKPKVNKKIIPTKIPKVAMNTEKQKENDAETLTLEIQKIIQKEIDLLRDLLTLFVDEENIHSKENPESKKNLIRKKAEVQKKLRMLRIEKETFFENYFFNQTLDCSTHLLKDQLIAIKEEVEKKHLVESNSSKLHLKIKDMPQQDKRKLKTLLLTIDQKNEEKEPL
jgi:hypothetical protein